MENKRWFNSRLPQTLVMAQWFLYFNAVIGLLNGTAGNGLGFIIVVGGAAGAFGIANDKRWGYYLGLGVAVLNVLLTLIWVDFRIVDLLTSIHLIGFLFDVALLAALLHPQSRDHQRIWFE